MVGKIILTIVLVIIILVLIAVMMWGIGVWGFFHAWSPGNWFGSNNTWNFGSSNELSAEGFQVTINDNEFSIGTSTKLPADAERGLEFETSASGISKIYLDFNHEDVTVVETSGNNIRLEQAINGSYSEDDIMRFGIVNKTLIAQTGWYNQTLNFGMHPGNHVTVYIPKGVQLDCTIDTASGKVDVESGMYKGLDIDTASGNVDVTDANAKNISVDTASGSAALSNVVTSGIDISTASGEVKISGAVEKGVSVDTTSGSITFDGSARSLDADTASGSVQAKVASGLQDFNVDSVSGSVTLLCGDTSDMKSINVDTASGSVALTLPEDNGFEINFDSVSGSLNNDFPTRDGEYLNGGFEIEVDTVSGSLNLMRAG